MAVGAALGVSVSSSAGRLLGASFITVLSTVIAVCICCGVAVLLRESRVFASLGRLSGWVLLSVWMSCVTVSSVLGACLAMLLRVLAMSGNALGAASATVDRTDRTCGKDSGAALATAIMALASVGKVSFGAGCVV